MTRGFDANVPARKPRTKISRVISELTSGAVAGAEDSKGLTTLEDVLEAPDTPARSQANGASDQAAALPLVDEPSAPAPPRPASRPTSRGSSGKERIARLRERLAVTAHVPTGAAEPKRTAEAVRDMVDALRARLEASIEERSQLSGQLEEARAAVARGEAELQKERRARASLEAQAEEHRRIADDAVAEAEALAAERDQVLDEIAELRRLEGDQASLLKEAEAALARRGADVEARNGELAESRELLDLRAAQIADLETRLQEALGTRSRTDARARELEAEVERLSAAGEALEALEALMRRGR
jgi:chromosome segregation ATPase